MRRLVSFVVSTFVLACALAIGQIPGANIVISKEHIEKAGLSIPASAIGEPVSSVKLYAPRWIEATEASPAYGVVEGSIFPVDPNGWPINFRVLLPASWSQRAIQSGGGGMNGSITVREGKNPLLNKGFALYGSDAGHQASGMGGPAGMQSKPLATGPASGDEWALNEEAIRNLGYMQMKKTHDAVMVIIERVYGKRPDYNYYVGGSQGGREGLTVAQRYPADYDGIISDVPIVNFSTLMLAPELIRIQEKPLANWVTPSKVKAIRAEFLRQCDQLDGLADGVINNYLDSRAIFNVSDGIGPADPWAALRTPNGLDPDPNDTSAAAKLTNGQIKTLEMCYSPYKFATPLANGVKAFGMWLPTTVPDDFGMITGTRYKGQEGAAENASVHRSLGTLGVTGFLMQDIQANPLDYVEGGSLNKRREEISAWLDATNPDLSAFYKHGGKIILTVGTMDHIASSGAQLDYYQSLINTMGQKKIDDFARLYVVPQGGHGLSGKSYKVNGEGKSVAVRNLPRPDGDDKLDLLMAWVENKQAPAKTLVLDEKGRIGTQPDVKGFLLCSYPNYPKYVGGPSEMASSYVSAEPTVMSFGKPEGNETTTIKISVSPVVVSKGRVERFVMPCEYEKERIIDVWLPEGYSKDNKYCVLYAQDGNNLFDATKMFNHQEWRLDEVADSLMATGQIRKTIIVGVHCTRQRFKEYLPQKAAQYLSENAKVELKDVINSCLGDSYLKFLVEELKPFIDKNYSVYKDRENTCIMGSSMGGLISLYAICEYPDVFGGAACISTHWPGLIPNTKDPGYIAKEGFYPKAMCKYMAESLPSPATHKIYFDHGDKTLDAAYGPYQNAADNVMAAAGYSSANWITRVYPGDAHVESSWASRVHVPLVFMLGKK